MLIVEQHFTNLKSITLAIVMELNNLGLEVQDSLHKNFINWALPTVYRIIIVSLFVSSYMLPFKFVTYL